MFFELRTYDLAPGKAPKYLEFFRTFGVERVTQHLPMMGYWMVESGRLNRIEHLWAYESFEERDACRASLVKDSVWMQDFVPTAFVDVVAQTNRFLILQECAPAFQAAVAARKTAHKNQADSDAMFATSLHAMAIADRPLEGSDETLASFKVASGPNPGQFLRLSSGDFGALLTGALGSETHEILRPLSLSPLR